MSKTLRRSTRKRKKALPDSYWEDTEDGDGPAAGQAEVAPAADHKDGDGDGQGLNDDPSPEDGDGATKSDDSDYEENSTGKKARRPNNNPNKAHISGRWQYDVKAYVEDARFDKPELVCTDLNPADLTLNYIKEHGLKKPIHFKGPNIAQLGMTMPSGRRFGVLDVKRMVGENRKLEVVKVDTQMSEQMTMRRFCDYFRKKKHTRDRLLNVLSLEFSDTPLAKKVKAPAIVRQLDWVELYWPKVLRNAFDSTGTPLYPKVQNYCLMSAEGCYTDFHVDFGGTSVWYHVLKGEKVFWVVEPTAQNLRMYEEWILSGPDQDFTFFGTVIVDCARVVLQAGDTFFIPSGWIHAVYTPVDSIVFGGNFLHSFDIEQQLKVWTSETHTHIHKKFRYPRFEQIHWYVARAVLLEASGKDYLDLDAVQRWLEEQQREEVSSDGSELGLRAATARAADDSFASADALTTDSSVAADDDDGIREEYLQLVGATRHAQALAVLETASSGGDEGGGGGGGASEAGDPAEWWDDLRRSDSSPPPPPTLTSPARTRRHSAASKKTNSEAIGDDGLTSAETKQQSEEAATAAVKEEKVAGQQESPLAAESACSIFEKIAANGEAADGKTTNKGEEERLNAMGLEQSAGSTDNDSDDQTPPPLKPEPQLATTSTASPPPPSAPAPDAAGGEEAAEEKSMNFRKDYLLELTSREVEGLWILYKWLLAQRQSCGAASDVPDGIDKPDELLHYFRAAVYEASQLDRTWEDSKMRQILSDVVDAARAAPSTSATASVKEVKTVKPKRPVKDKETSAAAAKAPRRSAPKKTKKSLDGEAAAATSKADGGGKTAPSKEAPATSKEPTAAAVATPSTPSFDPMASLVTLGKRPLESALRRGPQMVPTPKGNRLSAPLLHAIRPPPPPSHPRSIVPIPQRKSVAPIFDRPPQGQQLLQPTHGSSAGTGRFPPPRLVCPVGSTQPQQHSFDFAGACFAPRAPASPYPLLAPRAQRPPTSILKGGAQRAPVTLVKVRRQAQVVEPPAPTPTPSTSSTTTASTAVVVQVAQQSTAQTPPAGGGSWQHLASVAAANQDQSTAVSQSAVVRPQPILGGSWIPMRAAAPPTVVAGGRRRNRFDMLPALPTMQREEAAAAEAPAGDQQLLDSLNSLTQTLMQNPYGDTTTHATTDD